MKRARPSMADCRDCTMPIRFVRLETGSIMPVNPAPDAGGNIMARIVGGRLHGYVLSSSRGREPGYRAYMPHQAICEDRQRSRPKDVPADPALF